MIYQSFVRPLLFRHDPEKAHEMALAVLHAIGNNRFTETLATTFYAIESHRLCQKFFGITFPNPVGLAAGMDKSGVALRGFAALGFGHLEMGSITRFEQEGNPRPRMFRLKEDKAVINRMGFNNPGANRTAKHLSSQKKLDVPLIISIGKSKSVPPEQIEKVVEDYLYTFRVLHPYGDLFTLNVSSPNTPGLRQLQAKEFLTTIAREVLRKNRKLTKPGEKPKSVLVKIAPDLTPREIEEILEVVESVGIAGVIAVNTTTKRTGLRTRTNAVNETGGLSGQPLKYHSLDIVRRIRKRCSSLPIIGVGGIASGDDAYQMLCAGANLIQILTGLVYEGPGLPKRINAELLRLMNQNGISSIGKISPSFPK